MISLARIKPLASKKGRLVLLITLLFVITVGSYILWSKQVWAQYTPSYVQWYQGVSSDVKEITNLPSSTDKEQTIVSERLSKLALRIKAEQGAVCSMNSLLAWQQKVVSEYSRAQTACQKIASDTAAFQKRLDAVIAYNSDDRNLAKIIAAIPPTDELADETWASQVIVWSKAITAVEKLAVSTAFKSTKQQAVDSMTAVKIAWQGVVATHQAKDKGGYVAAYDKLAASYDGLNDIATVDDKMLAELSSSLNSESVELLN